MRGQFLLAELTRHVWALPPDRARAYANVLQRWSRHESPSDSVMQQIRADQTDRQARKAASARASGGAVAILDLHGVISQYGSQLDEISGGGSVSTKQLTAQLRSALADNDVGAIVLSINSPGGDVFGTPEFADELFAARDRKPVIAYADALAASAAYWIGSQASEFYVTPSGEVGSIGVVAMHEDWSAFNNASGVTITYLYAGKYKTEMNPDAPLTDEAIAFQQSRINDYYESFVRAVARGRGTTLKAVRNDMGEGRCFGANAAIAAKMVDGTSSFDKVITRARQLAQKPRAAAAAQTPALAVTKPSKVEVQLADYARRIRISAAQ